MREVLEAGLADHAGIEEVSAVHHNRDFHEVRVRAEVELAEFFPLGEQEQCLRAARRLIGGRSSR